jgi:hypothetical protein
MKLKTIPATETEPQAIDLYTENGNRFASINKVGVLRLFGEDMAIDYGELREVIVISDNFSLFYNNLFDKDEEIRKLRLNNIPTLARQ